ncbi:DUF6597 domain-containing transcriptional factor [Catenuloplanes indicus]|uniref:AraC-like DNA-binding protein n=1 Tax=Catenuloplanes indicus TaxID=137267 RepID=A0AAE4B0X9_9ACTN|nr:DUF6597 domain-containing transcriptional factor [Catenuloplanes indicus]MDQ0370815.1 AraC-like DNA-binding protein [Catenuloplanes indicus]
MEYVSRVPRPPLDGLIDDLYHLAGPSPYARLTLPPMPGALLIVNLGVPFRIRGGADRATAEYADGCVITTPTRAFEFGYPSRTGSVGAHVKPWGLAPFLPMPAAELCDRPVTLEQVWGRPAVAELRDRLAAADRPHRMLTLLEEELLRRLRETTGLGLVRRTGGVIAATGGAVPIGGLRDAAGVSSTHLAQRFKELIGVTPKRLARTHRFAAAVLTIDPAGPGRLGRARRCRGLLRPGALRPRVPRVHRAPADPVPGGPAAVPARAPGPHAGRLAAAGRLIFYKSRGSRRASLAAPQSRGEPAWARWSCTPRCRWTASSRTSATSPDRCSSG